MKKIEPAFDFVRSLWIGLQLGLPQSVQASLLPSFHEAKEVLRLLASPYLPISHLQGEGQGGPLTVTYGGLAFSKPFFKQLLFKNDPEETKSAQRPFWRFNLLNVFPASDIVIIEAYKRLIHRLPHGNTIVLPQFVHHRLPVQGDWASVESRFHRSALGEMEKAKKVGYEYEISRDDNDFKMFYQDMYLPTVQSRHGELASPMSFGQAYQYFKHGCLFLVKQNGRRLCGSVCHAVDGVVYFVIMGALQGDQAVIKSGIMGALNCLRLQWANQQGYRAVNFLGSGPFLNGGLFQYKRKWGTELSIPPHLHRQLWIKVQRNTPAVSRFLQDNPFIIVDKDANLHGMIVVDDLSHLSNKNIEEYKKRYATPGLKSLIIRSVDSLVEERRCIGNTRLVIPLTPDLEAQESSLPKAQQKIGHRSS